jgi:hypothetical protein
MNKVEIKTDRSEVMAKSAAIKEWCIEQFGPNRPRGKHNQKHRKLWSIKEDHFTYSINVFLRRREDATYVTLRWL